MKLDIKASLEGLWLDCAGWSTFPLGPLETTVSVNGQRHRLSPVRALADAGLAMCYEAEGCPIQLAQTWSWMPGGWRVSNRVFVSDASEVVFSELVFLGTLERLAPKLGDSARHLVVLEQAAYWGHVAPMFPEGGAEGASDYCWVMADQESGRSFLVGFETARRWRGQVRSRRVGPDVLARWQIAIDGGEMLLYPGESLDLEDYVLLVGDDPLALLDRYGDLVHDRHRPGILAQSPVTWCSWYPHRLGVSAERVLANARVGARRLGQLGLSTMVVDLGWEEGYLPSAFQENAQFPDGLQGLAQELQPMGLKLGTWAAPTSISEHDPLVSEHPEWLVHNPDGTLLSIGTWTWEPHGAIHVLDLTHPGAQGWLRERIRSLAARGSRYLKADFVGNLGQGAAKNRHDRRVVAGGGTETGHLAVSIMREAMRQIEPDALYLSCGGPELPGPSQADLLYTCMDTGNTGYVGWHHLQRSFLSTATHLFKHRRWGILQPSCLCVGLPGTLAEARLRATVAFMSGGQVDISDDLTTLPEDRWHVLTATLPPQGVAARPVDLFQSIRRISGGYSTSGTEIALGGSDPAPPASVWVLPMDGGWDRWTLVAVLDYQEPEQRGDRREGQLQTYLLPLERLGISPDRDLWAYEFWSGQFCGSLSAEPSPPAAYAHPGDMQMPVRRPERGALSASFFGPGVMLLALRTARDHPWVVGTTFHQSSGTELSGVRWDAEEMMLSGILRRPCGETGRIVVAGCDVLQVSGFVNGQEVAVGVGATGSVLLPVALSANKASWEIRIRPSAD